MTIIEIILLAIALAMDCFTVSIAGSIQHPTSNWKIILRSALFFGLFQGIMPLISWSIGVSFKTYIESNNANHLLLVKHAKRIKPAGIKSVLNQILLPTVGQIRAKQLCY